MNNNYKELGYFTIMSQPIKAGFGLIFGIEGWGSCFKVASSQGEGGSGDHNLCIHI
jgi:hypothetical protein